MGRAGLPAALSSATCCGSGAGLGWMNSLVYKATFRFILLPRAYSKQQFMQMVSGFRIGTCEIVADNIGFEVGLRK